jgi:hypothetical protein
MKEKTGANSPSTRALAAVEGNGEKKIVVRWFSKVCPAGRARSQRRQSFFSVSSVSSCFFSNRGGPPRDELRFISVLKIVNDGGKMGLIQNQNSN